MTAIVPTETGWYIGVQMTDFGTEMKFDSRDALIEWVTEDRLNRVIDSRCIDHGKSMYKVSVIVRLEGCAVVAATDKEHARKVAEEYFDTELSRYDDNLSVWAAEAESV